MARRPPSRTSRQSEPPAEVRLLKPRSVIDAELADRIGQGEQLESQPTAPTEEGLREARDAFRIWDDYNATFLKRSFSTDEERDKYAHVGPGVWSVDSTLSDEIDDFRRDVHQRTQRLVSLRGRLGLYDEDQQPQPPAPTIGATTPSTGTRVFLVHGHNDAAREAVARFVTRITGTEPVILHEQPNGGRTIIEKFEDYAATTRFAIILLTADDEGGEVGSAPRPRARQNVIFEMGFFVGTLGRKHVAVLHEDQVELPSDISGLLYTPLGSDGWQMRLAQELKAAGFDVDLNQLLI